MSRPVDLGGKMNGAAFRPYRTRVLPGAPAPRRADEMIGCVSLRLEAGADSGEV